MADALRHYVEALRSELARVGIHHSDVRRVGRLGHPRLYYAKDGKERFIMLPNTPSDSARGIANQVAQLRRMLGIAAPDAGKSPRPPKRRSVATAPASLAGCLDERPDPMAVLRAWKPAPPPSRWVWRRRGPREWAVEVAHG